MDNGLCVYLKTSLYSELPQEWIVDISEQTTCHGPAVFVRIESEPKAKNKRQLICLVEAREADHKIVVITKNISTKNIQTVITALRKIVDTNPSIFPDFCLTLIECLVNCPSCVFAQEYYK